MAMVGCDGATEVTETTAEPAAPLARLIEAGVAPGRIMLVTFTNRAAREMLGRVESLLGQDARTLSGGELQRMCLARTLVTQPETLLLDEPTSALDAQPKLVFESTARSLAAQGITIIWVTHDDAQAGRIADRVYRLRDGRLAGVPMKEAGQP